MADRLKQAREKAGFAHAKDASDAIGVPYGTYAQHENGIRNYPASRARQYARFFRTTPEWLLYGRGKPEAEGDMPTVEEMQAMIADALSEVRLDTRIADLPRIVAPSLHEQIERFQADRKAARALRQ